MKSMWTILDEVCRAHGVCPADLMGASRRRVFTLPRQEFMYLASLEKYQSTGARRWSSVQIGEFLGGRDHSTVLHGMTAHRERMEAQQ